jgi:hypothetical protein
VVSGANSEELDGETYYSMTVRAAEQDGYLSVVSSDAGLEVVEHICPGE